MILFYILSIIILCQKSTALENFTSFNIQLNGVPGFGYYVDCSFGSPSQNISVLVDTGSANLIVAGKSFSKLLNWYKPALSNSSISLEASLNIDYMVGKVKGSVWQDLFKFVNLSKINHFTKLTIPYFYMDTLSMIFLAVHEQNSLFLYKPQQFWEGIVGLAYSSITQQPVNIKSNYILVSPIETLVNGLNVQDKFSFLLCGSTKVVYDMENNSLASRYWNLNFDYLKTTGLWEIGSPDLKVINNMLFTPIIKKSYYQIILVDIVIADESIVDDCYQLNHNGVILDTGTTNLLLPSPVFHKLIGRILSALPVSYVQSLSTILPPFFNNTSLLCNIAHSQVGGLDGRPYDIFPAIELHLLSSVRQKELVLRLSLSPQQYLRYNGQVKSGNGIIFDCYTFGIQAAKSLAIFGSTFHEAFHVLYDREESKIGIENSSCAIYTKANLPKSYVIGLYKWETRKGKANFPTDCIPINNSGFQILSIVSISLSILSGLIALIIVIYHSIRIVLHKYSRNYNSDRINKVTIIELS